MSKVEKAILSVPIDKIRQIQNARITYGQEDLSELMTSLRHRGLLSPIGIRKLPTNDYEIVFGNRRLTAARKLGWKSIDAILVETKNDTDMLIINAVENMQRVDVPFAEQGRIFFGLEKAGLNRKEIAARIGISATKVSKIMDTYRDVPEAMRPRIVQGKPGLQVRGGTVPSSTAAIATSLRSRMGLKKKETDEILKLATKDGITGLHMRKIGGLVRAGVPLAKAMKQIENTRIITVQIAVNADHVKRLEKQHKTRINDLVYDQLAGMKWLGVVRATN